MKSVMLMALVSLGLFGCASSVDLKGLTPEVDLSTQGGCVKAQIRQPLPAPEGWSVDSVVTVQQDCKPQSVDTEETTDPEAE